MEIRNFVILFVILMTLPGCEESSDASTRSFYMGFSPMPYDISLEAVNYTYEKISRSADIINHHFDNGVPWPEAYANVEFSENIMSDWSFRKLNTDPDHKILVSLACLSPDRDRLANYRGDADDMPLPEPWSGYTFNDEHVKQAYLNYCKRAVDYFQPEYLNMNVEANLLYFLKPAAWSQFMEFHQFVYTELKKLYPDLLIFSSVTGVQLLEGFIEGNDHIQQRLATLQVIEYSDIYGISFYPHLSSYLGNPFPEGSFDVLFNLSPKPVAIAETGYPAESFVLNTTGTDVTINSDQQKQDKFTADLLAAASRRNALFVIFFVIRDYDQLWEDLGSRHDLIIAWRDTGLLSGNGEPRPAHTTWQRYFEKTHRQP